MTTKKKQESSTDSSSGSSSPTTSSSSSSGSDSSSSSDSESSSSKETSKQQPTSTKSQKGQDNKNASVLPTHKQQRKSIDCLPKSQIQKIVDKKPKNTQNKPPQSSKASTTSTKIVSRSNIVYSSDDDVNTSDVVIDNNIKQIQKKSSVKPKNSAALIAKASQNANKSSVIKGDSKVQKPVLKPTPSVQKDSSKSSGANSKKKPLSKSELNKKKSIFSPENSSDSEDGSNSKPSKAVSKNPNQKPRTKASPRAVNKPKPVERPKPEKKPTPKSKPIVSSGISTTSSSDSSNSSSNDCDSSADSGNSPKPTDSKKLTKKSSTPKQTKESHTESDGGVDKKQQITRKLTRSSSTRKSKHVVGTACSDTDSDTESTKRSLSRSPVKRAPVSAKGKVKNTKNTKRSDEIPILEERKCPVEGCNSLGHLGGRFDKHFTVEACPMYHNTTMQQCKEQNVERRKREEFRKKALDIFKKSAKSAPTPEQKAYLYKIKDLRSKFKMESTDDVKPIVDKNREPNLNNIVSEYDLKMFKDAQAIASEKIEEELEKLPNSKGTKYVEMGKFEMEVWYQSPYPEYYARLPKLYICEFCLRYMKSRTVLQRHVVKCVWRHPPGEEVYRKDKISVWEVDGKRYKQYCQNLCLLAKFFLDHKTLYYDVEPFLFYVMTMSDNEGCHTVGYFSKEKNSFLNYNVSCILTLPPYQRQGYGRLLIDFSYLLTRTEGKIGSPEKPLSDLGLISYRSYWKDVLLGYLCSSAGTTLSVKDISQEMAVHSYDIVSTLQALGMMKYWKGKHIILKKQDVLDEYVERVKRRGSLLKEVDPSCLRWRPFVPPQPAPV